MNDELQKQIEEKVKLRETARASRVEREEFRQRAVANHVCPECGGDLDKYSPAAMVCKDCGADYRVSGSRLNCTLTSAVTLTSLPSLFNIFRK